jgi:hypothetical protein
VQRILNTGVAEPHHFDAALFPGWMMRFQLRLLSYGLYSTVYMPQEKIYIMIRPSDPSPAKKIMWFFSGTGSEILVYTFEENI